MQTRWPMGFVRFRALQCFVAATSWDWYSTLIKIIHQKKKHSLILKPWLVSKGSVGKKVLSLYPLAVWRTCVTCLWMWYFVILTLFNFVSDILPYSLASNHSAASCYVWCGPRGKASLPQCLLQDASVHLIPKWLLHLFPHFSLLIWKCHEY